MKLKLIPIFIFVVLLIFILFFYNKQNSQTGSTVAIENVRNLPEIQDYLNRIPDGKVELGSEDDQNYNIQVYEVKDGHTATFNWYYVNKSTGEIKKEFDY